METTHNRIFELFYKGEEKYRTFKWSKEGELVLDDCSTLLNEKAMLVLGSDPNWWGSEYLEEKPVWMNLAAGAKVTNSYREEVQADIATVLEANDISVKNLRVDFENDTLLITTDR